MGLDMSVYEIKNEPNSSEEYESLKSKKVLSSLPYSEEREICYWRKHPDLHGWMRELYWNKGGTGEFNGSCVRLTMEDLDSLEKDIENQNLPFTQGFFFGQSYPDEESREYHNKDDMENIYKMRKALKNGSLLFYSSSW